MDTEPKHREAVHRSVQEVLAVHKNLDAQLWAHLHDRLNGFDKVKPLEIGRFWDVNKLTECTKRLQADLEDFRVARAGQASEWDQYDTPGVGDALNELSEIAGRAVDTGASIASSGYKSLANLIGRSTGDEEKEPVKLDATADIKRDADKR